MEAKYKKGVWYKMKSEGWFIRCPKDTNESTVYGDEFIDGKNDGYYSYLSGGNREGDKGGTGFMVKEATIEELLPFLPEDHPTVLEYRKPSDLFIKLL